MDIDEKVATLTEHPDFTESRSAYDEMYGELEEVLDKYSGLVFPHEKVAALSVLNSIVTFSECVDLGD